MDPVLQSHPTTPFFLKEDMILRCLLAIVSSSLDIFFSTAVFYVYFRHSKFRRLLTESFNALSVAACMAQVIQAVNRIVSATLLLSHEMSHNACLITGTLDTGLDTTSLVFMVGFFVCIINIRLKWCRNCTRNVTPPFVRDHLAEIVWTILALCAGATSAYLSSRFGEDLHSPDGDASASSVAYDKQDDGSPYGYTIGWCTLGRNPMLYLGTHMMPVAMYALCALITVISLRCSCGTGLRIQQRLEWSRHWPIYLRLFGVAMVMGCTYAFTIVVHSLGRDKHDLMTLSCVFESLWPVTYAIVFLLTEGAFHEWSRKYFPAGKRRDVSFRERRMGAGRASQRSATTRKDFGDFLEADEPSATVLRTPGRGGAEPPPPLMQEEDDPEAAFLDTTTTNNEDEKSRRAYDNHEDGVEGGGDVDEDEEGHYDDASGVRRTNNPRHSDASDATTDAAVDRGFGLAAPGGGFTNSIRTLLGMTVRGEQPKVISSRTLSEHDRLLFAERTAATSTPYLSTE